MTLVFVVAFSACNPNEDIYDELDELKSEYEGLVENFIFSADDYATASGYAILDAVTSEDTSNAEMIEDMEAFNMYFTAEDYVGSVLAEYFPEYGKNSRAYVTYNNYIGDLAYLSNYTDATTYELTDNDYENLGGDPAAYHAFTSENDVSLYMPTIIEDAGVIADPDEGDLLIVTYKFTEPLSSDKVLLTMSSDDYKIIVDSVKNRADADKYVEPDYGTSEFYYGANYYYNNFEVRAYKWQDYEPYETLSEEKVDSIIEIRIQEAIQLMLKVKYSGTLVEGNHYYVTYETYSGSNNTYTVDYLCTTAGANPEFELKAGPIVGTLSFEELVNTMYEYKNNIWGPAEDIYILSEKDYIEIGATGGDLYFSSISEADDYIPTYLANHINYAQVEDTIIILFGEDAEDDFSAIHYEFDGSVWSKYDDVIEITNQFVHNGEEWLFDPTITLIMSSSDYQIIVDYVRDEYGEEYLNSYKTADYIYGADAWYSNFDLGDYDTEMFGDGEDDWQNAVEEAISTILLPELYPDATLQVNGVDLYYNVIFGTYNYGVNANYAMMFQVTKAGPDPEFTLDDNGAVEQ